MLKNAVKSIFSKNTYINDKFYRLFSSGKTAHIEELNAIMNSWDTIKDVSLLREFRKLVDQGELFYTTDPNYSNAHIYGIWESLFGKIAGNNYLSTPAVEHGLIFHNQIFTDLQYTARMTFATFSPFRKNIIRKYSERPVFCVGPYIHYADSFYNQEELKTLKKRLGKTLLVFPTHSTDTAEISVKEDLFCNEVAKMAKNYDTVMVNAFWWNINDKLVDRLQAEGYHISSAGFRDDKMFLNRLKTIISLSDCAVGDSVGTHIGYCLFLNVPFQFLKLDTRVNVLSGKERDDLNFVENHMRCIRECFENYDGIITEKQNQICKKYWGFECIKTREDLNDIVNINRDILKRCKGNVFLEKKAITELMNEYQKANQKRYMMLRFSL